MMAFCLTVILFVQRAIAKLNTGKVPRVDGVMMTFYTVKVAVQ